MATVLGGRRPARFEAEEIQMLRFDPTTSEILVATSGGVRTWDADTGTTRVVDGSHAIGADRFAGGLVVWSTP
jgi:hypothetical protein